MKRRISVLITAALLLCCLIVPAFASGTSARLNYVTDMADLLTDDQISLLEAKAEKISQQYELGVYILTVNDYHQYSNFSQISDAAVEIYNSYLLGWGNDHAGTMLMLSMADREYNLDFNSSRADYVFTEAGRDRLEDRFFPFLKRSDYYGAFDAYLDTCAEFLQAAKEGHPVGEGERSSADEPEGLGGGIAAIFGAIAAALTGVSVSSPMKSAAKKTNANSYVVEGSLELTRRSDMFLHRTVTRVPRQTQSSGGGSHGSTHYSSGSHSGRSGKF